MQDALDTYDCLRQFERGELRQRPTALAGGRRSRSAEATRLHHGPMEGMDDTNDEQAGLPSMRLFTLEQNTPRRAEIRLEYLRTAIIEFLSAAVQVGVSVSASQLYMRGTATDAAAVNTVAFAQMVSYMWASFVFSPHSEGFGSPLLLWSITVLRQSAAVDRSYVGKWMIALVLPLVQLGGAILGTYLADVLIAQQVGPGVAERMRGMPQVLPGASVAAAFFIEACYTFLLVFSMALPQNSARMFTPKEHRKRMGGQAQSGEISRPIVAGFVFSLGLWSGGALVTGVGLSPWRALAPAIVFNFWPSTIWVHLVGPVVGWAVAMGVGFVLDGPVN